MVTKNKYINNSFKQNTEKNTTTLLLHQYYKMPSNVLKTRWFDFWSKHLPTTGEKEAGVKDPTSEFSLITDRYC